MAKAKKKRVKKRVKKAVRKKPARKWSPMLHQGLADAGHFLHAAALQSGNLMGNPDPLTEEQIEQSYRSREEDAVDEQTAKAIRRDLAKRFKISEKTVRRVLQKRGVIEAGGRQEVSAKVRDEILELAAVPHATAKSISTQTQVPERTLRRVLQRHGVELGLSVPIGERLAEEAVKTELTTEEKVAIINADLEFDWAIASSKMLLLPAQDLPDRERYSRLRTELSKGLRKLEDPKFAGRHRPIYGRHLAGELKEVAAFVLKAMMAAPPAEYQKRYREGGVESMLKFAEKKAKVEGPIDAALIQDLVTLATLSTQVPGTAGSEGTPSVEKLAKQYEETLNFAAVTPGLQGKRSARLFLEEEKKVKRWRSLAKKDPETFWKELLAERQAVDGSHGAVHRFSKQQLRNVMWEVLETREEREAAEVALDKAQKKAPAAIIHGQKRAADRDKAREAARINVLRQQVAGVMASAGQAVTEKKIDEVLREMGEKKVRPRWPAGIRPAQLKRHQQFRETEAMALRLPPVEVVRSSPSPTGALDFQMGFPGFGERVAPPVRERTTKAKRSKLTRKLFKEGKGVRRKRILPARPGIHEPVLPRSKWPPTPGDFEMLTEADLGKAQARAAREEGKRARFATFQTLYVNLRAGDTFAEAAKDIGISESRAVNLMENYLPDVLYAFLVRTGKRPKTKSARTTWERKLRKQAKEGAATRIAAMAKPAERGLWAEIYALVLARATQDEIEELTGFDYPKETGLYVRVDPTTGRRSETYVVGLGEIRKRMRKHGITDKMKAAGKERLRLHREHKKTRGETALVQAITERLNNGGKLSEIAKDVGLSHAAVVKLLKFYWPRIVGDEIAREWMERFDLKPPPKRRKKNPMVLGDAICHRVNAALLTGARAPGAPKARATRRPQSRDTASRRAAQRKRLSRLMRV